MLVETWGQTEPDATAVAQQTSVIASLLENPDQVGKHYNRSTWTVVHTGHTGYTGIATPTGLPLMVPFRETSPPPPHPRVHVCSRSLPRDGRRPGAPPVLLLLLSCFSPDGLDYQGFNLELHIKLA
jgi:hypothetical protein